MNTNTIRNRSKGHRRVRAGDLAPHDWNYRTHLEMQRAALLALHQEVGFARSLLASELPDGRLELLDDHRSSMLSCRALASSSLTRTSTSTSLSDRSRAPQAGSRWSFGIQCA